MAKSQRRTYLVNPSFQLKFSILMSFIVLVSSAFYPFTIYDLIEKYISVVSTTNPERL